MKMGRKLLEQKLVLENYKYGTEIPVLYHIQHQQSSTFVAGSDMCGWCTANDTIPCHTSHNIVWHHTLTHSHTI